ncbi:MAG: MBL fold metallo-hydrolase [Parcubacteria group bacterium]|nr:MBL fold metallo-hydrolase [Parcubacteria group bacterium]
MFIELLGLSGVKIQSGDTVILLAPPSAKSELRASHMKADVVVLGNPADATNVEQRAEKLLVVSAPGEFEASGVFVYCLSNPPRGQTVSLLSRITVEGITVAHLGALSQPLSGSELELFEGVDILLLPVGGKNVLDAKGAKGVVESVEPRVVIPMHFSQKGLKTAYDDAAKFFKELGASPKPQERIKVLKKDLPADTMNIVYLTP